jgi:His-Xaa-Ser system protein HxsD
VFEAVRLSFDEHIYSVEEIQKAAYRGSAYFTIDISVHGSKIDCSLSPALESSDQDFARAVEDFKKDVLDYHLRAKLKAESEPIRNLILGIAFSRTGLQGNE